MATQIQYRRGTAAQNNTFTGALGEVSVDTTNATLRVHDGATAGGAGTIVSIVAGTGGSNITGNLLPSANVTYDLGSPTKRWRTGYFSANTVDIGGGQISLDPTNGFSFTISGTTSSMAANGAITANTLTAPTVRITSTTSSINSTTGALVVAGGIGVGGNIYATVFNGRSTSASYADLAEIYSSDDQHSPGTVVIFGGESEITQSTVSHDTRIAGVVSTNPAYLMNDTRTETGLPVALQGRVPCRVLGPVSKGDRVVSSHIPGVAQRLDLELYQPGCIIGKTLQAIDSADILTIEVVVGRV